MERWITLLLLVMLASTASAEIDAFDFSQCKPANESDTEEGKPIIRVAPMYPSAAIEKGVQACVVIAYSLERKGNELFVRDAAVANVFSSGGFKDDFSEVAMRAFEKWRFHYKAHPDLAERDRFYSIVRFELVAG